MKLNWVKFITGGDNKIGVAVRKPDGSVALPYKWQAVSEYEENTAVEGYWSVCLDNQFSKFSAKLVNLYLTTFRYDEWEKFAEELQVCKNHWCLKVVYELSWKIL